MFTRMLTVVDARALRPFGAPRRNMAEAKLCVVFAVVTTFPVSESEFIVVELFVVNYFENY